MNLFSLKSCQATCLGVVPHEAPTSGLGEVLHTLADGTRIDQKAAGGQKHHLIEALLGCTMEVPAVGGCWWEWTCQKKTSH